jgi:hypothetical protein
MHGGLWFSGLPMHQKNVFGIPNILDRNIKLLPNITKAVERFLCWGRNNHTATDTGCAGRYYARYSFAIWRVNKGGEAYPN